MNQQILKQTLTYNPETGVFTKNSTGKPVGWVNKYNGYVYVSCKGKDFLAHRLAFLYINGVFPPDEVDHKNGKRHENMWANLREVSKSQNQMNKESLRKLPKNVYQHISGKFRVCLKVDKVKMHFGYYEDLELAELVAQEAQNKYHGQYARGV